MAFECERCDRYCDQYELALCEYEDCNTKATCPCGYGSWCIDCAKKMGTQPHYWLVKNNRIFCDGKCFEKYYEYSSDNSDTEIENDPNNTSDEGSEGSGESEDNDSSDSSGSSDTVEMKTCEYCKINKEQGYFHIGCDSTGWFCTHEEFKKYCDMNPFYANHRAVVLYLENLLHVEKIKLIRERIEAKLK